MQNKMCRNFSWKGPYEARVLASICYVKKALTCGVSPCRPELLQEQSKARNDKKKLRKVLREFEDEFFKRSGRSV